MIGIILNRKLELEELSQVSDGAGGFVSNWTTLGTLWGRLRPGSGRESLGGTVVLSSAPYVIIVRAAPFGAPSRPRPDQRFRAGARVFRILAVSDDDRDAAYLTCRCIEEVAG
ncbi:MAG: head-tail adaptor protein [Pseudomonadota bacterium]